MANYTWLLAQLQNASYLITYFTALYLAYRSNAVTDDMLAVDKTPFLKIGACEAAAQLLFMLAASHLPGVLIPLLSQVYLLWNLLFASLLLGTRFDALQVVGAIMVVLGAIFAAVPANAAASLSGTALQADLRYVAVAVCCFAFPALASCIKEGIFRSARERLGQPLSIWVVNSFGSLAQSFFVLLLLPVSVSLNGLSLQQLPDYIPQGVQCLVGASPACGSDCSGAPLLPLLYVAANLVFNVSILLLLRTVGTVTTSLVGSSLVPLSIFTFTLPLPYLQPAQLGIKFTIGSIVLMSGLLLYNYSSWRRSQAGGQAAGAKRG